MTLYRNLFAEVVAPPGPTPRKKHSKPEDRQVKLPFMSRRIDKRALKKYWNSDQDPPECYHGNLRGDLQPGMWLYPEHEATGGFSELYYTPNISLAGDYVEDCEAPGHYGGVYRLLPVNGRIDPDYEEQFPDGLVCVCDRALIIEVVY